MNRERLQQHLFSETTRLFCVLDGASVPLLPKRLYSSGATNFCLFSGDLKPDMLYAAPYVVHLDPGNPITDWILTEGFGKHWGIFLHSRFSIQKLRKQFSSLVNVYDENAKSLIFRFYDPRVLSKFLPTCTPEEIGTMFGYVDTFFAESENGENLLSFGRENGKLKQTELK